MQVFDKEIIKEKCKWLIMWEKCVFMLWEQGVEGSNPFAPTTKKGLEKVPFSFSTPLYYSSVRSTISASGAFFITEAMPFFIVASLAYI